MKTCSRCREEYPATLEFFPPNKRVSDGFASQCRACCHGACRSYKLTDAGKACQEASYKKYYATVNGNLHRLYHNMNDRCKDKRRKVYDNIENKFMGPEHLISYVVEVLKVDPRGKVCHRIDNDGHYEPGNIEFLTKKGHDKIHVEMRIACGI